MFTTLFPFALCLSLAAASPDDHHEPQELSDRELALDGVPLPLPAPVLDERQSVGVGGANVSTGNITAGVGDISLDVGDITIKTGDLTLEDIVLGNIVVIVDVGVGANTTNSTGGDDGGDGGGGDTGGQATTRVTNGREEIVIETVVTDPSTHYTFSTEPLTTTIAEISATDLVLSDGDLISPTIRPRAAVTPPPALEKRQVSVSPTVSVGPVSAGIGPIGASVGNINVTVGDVLVGLGDISLKNITIGNVFVSVNIQANLKRDSTPTNGVRVERRDPLPEPRQTDAPERRSDVVEERVMQGIKVEGRRAVRV